MDDDDLPVSLIPDVVERKKRIAPLRPPCSEGEDDEGVGAAAKEEEEEKEAAKEEEEEEEEGAGGQEEEEEIVVPVADWERTKTLKELREMCAEKGLSAAGKKADLVSRLTAAG